MRGAGGWGWLACKGVGGAVLIVGSAATPRTTAEVELPDGSHVAVKLTCQLLRQRVLGEGGVPLKLACKVNERPLARAGDFGYATC